MESAFHAIDRLTDSNPGYSTLVSTLSHFFITVASSVLSQLCSPNLSVKDVPRMIFAHVNAVACFTPRIFYDTVLNALAKWEPSWDEGAANWDAHVGLRGNESVDAFVHALRAVGEGAKGKGKESDGGRIWKKVIFVEKAERLKENMPDLLVPLTRLAEMVRQDITVVFHSEVRWEDIKPPLGASPDPFFIDVPPPGKKATIQRLIASFPSASNPGRLGPDNPYHPALHPLYSHFISTLHSVCAPFVSDPEELAYLAAARWPGFARAAVQAATSDNAEDSDDLSMDETRQELLLSEDARIRLIRQFTPTLTAAMEALYPRQTHAAAWARAHPTPPPSSLSFSERYSAVNTGVALSKQPHAELQLSDPMPRMAQFILLAAFLASTNPPKTDIRMFGRGLDPRRKRRKGGGAMGKRAAKSSGPSKLPQRLLGPLAFPLDRLIAILGILLEGFDIESRPPAPQFTRPGEETEMELGRVGVYATIVELSAVQLLHRMSPVEKLDGTPTFKCGIGYEAALELARGLDVPLNDLMWDPA